MSTSQQLTVYKYYPTPITIKADGYYDYKTTKTFTTAGETVNIPSTEMTAYDGLDCSFSTASNNLYLADFSDTTLPNGNTPSPTLYAMKASGQTYPIPSTPVYDNYTIVGSPTVNVSTGVVSGFSQSNYLQLPQAFNPDNNPWDVYVSFNKPLSQVSNNTQIISTSGFQLGINMNAYFWLWVWDKDGNGICDSALNLTYSSMPEHTICHIYFTGSEYKVDYSIDNINWINIYQNTSSVACRSSDIIIIGNAASSSYRSEYFRGSVDLSETYIKVNNSIWWEANSSPDVQIEGCLYNYTDDGSAVTLNAYQTGTSIILTPDVSYNGIKLGTVNVPPHSV